ncbi:MAG TPA: hypothetical protein VJ183_20075 [Chloroflexia bacterium]|nr:hypothetical protein [Chloroflexia bacterium]
MLQQQFVTERDRDAWATIAGFVYQVDLTILRWLELGDGQYLELECGEDIDLITADLHGGAHSGQLGQRLLEQVKRYQSPISLRSRVALEALASAVEHLANNPGLDLAFQFTTTAAISREQPSPLPDRIPAITAWHEVRAGTLTSDLQGRILQGIRAILTGASRPANLNENTWQRFKTFAAEASQEDLLSFVKRFEWSTGAADPEEVMLQVRAVLIERGAAKDTTEAWSLYQRLFHHVFRVLTSPDLKRLSSADLSEQLTQRTLTADELALVEGVHSILADLTSRVQSLERVQEEQVRSIEAIQSQVAGLAERYGIYPAQVRQLPRSFRELPPIPPAVSRRSKTVANLLDTIQQFTWTALHGSIGSGKTLLAALSAYERGQWEAWIKLSTNQLEQASIDLDEVCYELIGDFSPGPWQDLYRKACTEVGTGKLVIIHDLPRLNGNDPLTERLVLLTLTAAKAGLKLLTTSPFRPPNRVRTALRGTTLRIVAVPAFTDEEVLEVLERHGAPREVLNDKFISAMSSLTDRHPQRLASLAQYLEQRRWQITDEVVEGLLRSEYSQELDRETTHALISKIDDVDSRELLYRLGLSKRSFSLEDVRAIASLERVIDRPTERLDALVGVWVQPETDVLMSVSPLITALDGRDLTANTYRACHKTFGRRIMAKGTITASQLIDALTHFNEAQEYDQAALTLSVGLTELSRLEPTAPDAGLSAVWANTPLPEQMNLGLRIYARLRQILARTQRGLQTAHAVRDLDALIDRAGEEEIWALSAVMGLTPIAETSPIPAANLYKYLLRVVRHFDTAMLPNGTPLRDVVPIRPELIIWWHVVNIRTVDDMFAWLNTFEHFSDEERGRVLADDLAVEGCLWVASRVWLTECEKPAEKQEWAPILAALKELEQRARGLGVELLWASAVHSQIIILAESCHDLPAAKKQAEEALAEASVDPRVQFLIREAIGKQGTLPEAEAIEWLRSALQQETSAYPADRMRAFLKLSRLIAPTDLASALSYSEQAVEVANNSDEVADTEVVKALGELTIARYLSDELASTYDDWELAGEKLLGAKEHTEDWKSTFVIYGHCAGYFARFAMTGHPPEAIASGEPYVAPQLGMFTGHVPERAQYYDTKTSILHISYLMANLAMYAGAVGKVERVIAWSVQGFDLARAAGETLAVSQMGFDVVPALLINNRFGEALDTALATGIGGVAVRLDYRKDTTSVRTRIDVDEVLGPKPNENWVNAEQIAGELGVLPAAFRLGSIALKDAGEARDCAQEIASLCRQVGIEAAEPAFWNTAAEIFEESFVRPVGAKRLIERPSATVIKDRVLHAVAYIGASLQTDCIPSMALEAHLAIASAVELLRSADLVHRLIVTPFFKEYWQRSFARSRFRFRAPIVVQRGLEAAEQVGLDDQPQAVLRAVATGLDVRIPTDHFNWLHKKVDSGVPRP